jgi:hypothetical protein
VWLHYKDTPTHPKRYQVLGVSNHTETDEQLITYKALYGEQLLWTRSLSMWNETVTVSSPWPDGAPATRHRFLQSKVSSVSVLSQSKSCTLL